MTEKQPYDVVRRAGGMEVRRYPQHVVVEAEVSASFEDAGSRAFRYLFGYISGDNAARQSIHMTAPVIQSASQRIAMTAPVVQTSVGDKFRVAFVLPASLDEASAPLPVNREVTVRTVPSRLAAARRFSGRWSLPAYEKQRSKLLEEVRDAGLTAIGEPWFARFDPPLTPWLLRHNEVVVELAE